LELEIIKFFLFSNKNKN